MLYGWDLNTKYKRIGALGRIGLKRGRIARGASHLVGAVMKDRIPKVRVATCRKATDPGEVQVAKTLKIHEIQDNSGVQRLGKAMFQKLSEECRYRKRQQESLPLFQALLDPRSLESTVQNLFIFSTLVAGCMAKVLEGETREPIIEMCTKQETTRLANDRDSREPIVLEMDMETYELLVSRYQLREPFIDFGFES